MLISTYVVKLPFVRLSSRERKNETPHLSQLRRQLQGSFPVLPAAPRRKDHHDDDSWRTARRQRSRAQLERRYPLRPHDHRRDGDHGERRSARALSADAQRLSLTLG